MKNKFLLLACLILFFSNLFLAERSVAQNVNVKFTATEPEIDGFVEETWDAATPIPLDKNFRTEYPTVIATWQALWDQNNFYIVVVVEDDNHWPAWEAAGDSWLYDKPEVYWDVNEVLNDGGGGGISPGHWQLADGFTDGMYDTPITKAGGASVNPGGTYAYSLIGEGYCYEMKVPWANLKDNSGAAYNINSGRLIGFDVTVVDQDEGVTTSRQRKVWTVDGIVGGADEAWNNMDGAGTITINNHPTNSFYLSSSTVNLSASEGSHSSVNVTSSVSWTAASNQSWLSVSPGSGTGNGTVTFTATANTGLARTGTVTFSPTGLTTKTVTVTQASGVPSLSVSPATLNVTSLASSTATFTITSNIAWTVSSDQTWISVNHISGNGNSVVTVTAGENTSETERIAIVSVSGTGVDTKTITVTQRGKGAQFSKTISISSCGLAAALTQNEKNTITDLTVIGKLCSSDFTTMKNMPMLEMLDLSGATVYSPSNRIPEFALSYAKLKSIIFPTAITHIDNSAFLGCTGLTSVTIPSSVTCMGTNVFKGCTGLTSVFIPASCTCMGANSFSGCTALTTLTTSYFSKSVFNGCDHLTSVTIADGSDWIPPGSFEGQSGLTSIIIPASATDIGDKAFKGCTGLTSFNLPANVMYLHIGVFSGCTGLTSITIPSKVLSIDKNAFSGCTGLTSMTIPESVTAVKDSAFAGCIGLTSLFIPATVTSVGKDVFSGCTGLTTVTTPMANDADGNSIFMGCDQLTSIIIPDGVTSIKQNDFYGLTVVSLITIPESVTSIGDKAFSDCSGLTSINIPLGVNYFGQSAFTGCSSLASITIPESITSIGFKTFLNCSSLFSIDLPPSIVSIGYQAFDGCSSLYSIKIPASVTYIPTNAFRNCSSLTTFEIPALVSSIGMGAFSGCCGLTSIFVNSPIPVDLSNSPEVFAGIDKSTCTLFVPIGSKIAYQIAYQWKDFMNIVEFNGFWLSNKAIEFTADYGNSTINILSKHEWIASSDQTWLQVSPASGRSGETFTVNVDINKSTIARTAIITVSVIGYPDQTVEVTQDGGLIILSVPYDNKQIGKEANSTYSFEVFTNSNISWIATCDQTWISVSPATGTGEAEVTLTAEANHTKQTRNANITITVPGVTSQTFTVTQEVGDGTGLTALSSGTINLYPNPVTDCFRVSGLEDKATIRLTDLNGRYYLSKQISKNEKIDIGSLPRGIYIVEIVIDNGNLKRKLVKE